MNKNKLFRWSIVAALAGFIFGFDTVVISGANLPIKELWHTSPLFHGFFIMSMALWGTVLGALFGGIPTEKYGRKKVLLWIGIFFAISAIGSAVAPDPYTFSFFRFIGGVGIGVSSVVAPTYISEISTPATRGRLGALYQFNIVFGILVAFFPTISLKVLMVPTTGVGCWACWQCLLSSIPYWYSAFRKAPAGSLPGKMILTVRKKYYLKWGSLIPTLKLLPLLQPTSRNLPVKK